MQFFIQLWFILLFAGTFQNVSHASCEPSLTLDEKARVGDYTHLAELEQELSIGMDVAHAFNFVWKIVVPKGRVPFDELAEFQKTVRDMIHSTTGHTVTLTASPPQESLFPRHWVTNIRGFQPPKQPTVGQAEYTAWIKVETLTARELLTVLRAANSYPGIVHLAWFID